MHESTLQGQSVLAAIEPSFAGVEQRMRMDAMGCDAMRWDGMRRRWCAGPSRRSLRAES